MDNLRKRITKNIARTVCHMSGSTKPYRRIMNIFSCVEKTKYYSEKFSNVNCHGFTLYALGIDPSENPRNIPAEVMEEFLGCCFESQAHNGIILVMREGLGKLAHSALYINTSSGPIFIQKKEIGLNYSIESHDKFLADEGLLKTELSPPQFYKIFPDRIKIPDYFLSS